MNPKSLLVLLVVLVAGVLGGAAAYQFAVPASSADPAREALVVDQSDRAGKAKQRPPHFAPCRKRAKLEGNKCVTDVVRTVVVPGSNAPVRPAASAPVGSSQGDDEGRDHGGEGDDNGNSGDNEDHGDDHSGQDDGDDDDEGGDDEGGDDDDDDGGHDEDDD